MTLVVSPARKVRVEPDELGAAAHFLKAVKTAVRVRRRRGSRCRCSVDVKQAKLERLPRRPRGRRPTASPSTRASRSRTSGRSPGSRSRGVRLKQVDRLQRLSLAIRKHERAPFELPYQELAPGGHRGRPRPRDRDQARLEAAPVLQRHEAQADVPDRDGAVVVPDADREVRDRHEAAKPVVVPARRAPPGPRAPSPFRPGPATRSARAGWESPRRTSGSTARRTPPRSATRRRTAASAC